MDADVIAFGFDPVNLIDLEHEDPVVVFNHQTVEVARLVLDFGEQTEYLPIHVVTVFFSKPLFRPLQGQYEPRAVEWLEQVVNRLHVERSYGILLISCDEDEQRTLLSIEGLGNSQAVYPRHLHIQKDQVRRQFPRGGYGFGAVRAFADDDDFMIFLEQFAQAFAGERLVVNDQDSDRFG